MDKKVDLPAGKAGKTAKDTFAEILETLGIEGDFEISSSEEGYDITLSTEDSGIVIGHHGDTLEALQIVTALCVSKKLGEFKRVSIEVGDYKKNREDWLKNLALETKEKALREERAISLPELKSWERRIVHLALQDDKEVTSESIGEGRERVLTIKPK